MNLNLLRFSIILFICSNLSCEQTHSKDLKSIHEKFEYKNKPIDPKLLHKFLRGSQTDIQLSLRSI